jgi:hypothetical protein
MKNIIRSKRGEGAKIVILAALLFASLLSCNSFAAITQYAGYVGWVGSFVTPANYLKDNGGTNLPVGSLVQIIYAGANGTIDPPQADGSPAVGEVLIKSIAVGEDYQFGNFASSPGMVYDVYQGTYESTNGAPKVYVRVWNGSTISSSTFYGTSSLLTPVIMPAPVPPFDPANFPVTVNTTTPYTPPVGTPVVTNVVPPAGTTGSTIRISGSSFGASAGTVRFYVLPGKTTSALATNVQWSDTMITCDAPAGTVGQCEIDVVKSVAVFGTWQTFYHTVPYIASQSVSSGPAGSTTGVRLNGYNLNSAPNSITFDNNTGSPFHPAGQFTTNIATYDVPGGAVTGPYDVYVTTSYGNSNKVTFTVTSGGGGAAFAGISPVSGSQGQTLIATIDGTNTHFQSMGTPTIAFNGTAVTAALLSRQSETKLTCIVTVGAGAAVGARNVTVTTGSEIITGVGAFTVLVADNLPPYVVSVSPIRGATGVSVNPTITIVFADAGGSGVDTSTFIANNFHISGEAAKSGPHIPINTIINVSGNSVTFGLVNLATNETITIEVTNIKDLAPIPNTIVRDFWSFTTTTESGTAPDNRLFESQGGIMMAYPNPFNPLDKAHPLQMLFSAATGEAIDIYIFDATARILWTHKDNQLTSNRIVVWDGETSFGEVVSNGIYLVRVVKDDKIVAKAKILVKKK